MGVEHGFFCHKCKEWIDGHKNWSGYFGAGPGAVEWKELEKSYVDRPPNWEETKEDSAKFNLYWTMRIFWFLFHHKDHGKEVEWLTDGADQDKYYELYEKYKEVHKP